MAFAQEKNTISLSQNRIRLKVTTGPFGSPYWGEFAFVDIGNNIAKLRPIYNGEPVLYSKLPDNLYLNKPVFINLIDSNGNTYATERFPAATSIKLISQFFETYNFRYGIDSIQIIPIYDNNPFTITGYIYSNLDNTDYSSNISKNIASNNKFRVEKDGLYAEYIHQEIIPDGEYIIETGSNLNNILSLKNNQDIIAKGFDNTINQKFYFKYDQKNKAYKIISQVDKFVLSWNEQSSAKVFTTLDQNNNDQFWYLQKLQDGNYRVLNASNTSKVLNLDNDNITISMAPSKNNIQQEFSIVKSDEKINFLNGQWRISSKISDSNFVDVSSLGDYNVRMFDSHIGNSQRWTFKYDSSKDAYIITNVFYPDRILAWNDYAGSKNVFITTFNSYKLEHYWKLVQLPDGYFIIKNAKNENLVLDVYEGNEYGNIQVYQEKSQNNDNQKFKFTK